MANVSDVPKMALFFLGELKCHPRRLFLSIVNEFIQMFSEISSISVPVKYYVTIVKPPLNYITSSLSPQLSLISWKFSDLKTLN